MKLLDCLRARHERRDGKQRLAQIERAIKSSDAARLQLELDRKQQEGEAVRQAWDEYTKTWWLR